MSSTDSRFEECLVDEDLLRGKCEQEALELIASQLIPEIVAENDDQGMAA